ncbi:MAG: hypothetical protein HKN85_02460 [Gammaproteobacteria bacterium]|nr:hypothetical protein [Gammaproteobacteria bacterium]
MPNLFHQSHYRIKNDVCFSLLTDKSVIEFYFWIRAALHMLDACKQLNKIFRKQGIPELTLTRSASPTGDLTPHHSIG